MVVWDRKGLIKQTMDVYNGVVILKYRDLNSWIEIGSKSNSLRLLHFILR